MTITLTAGVIVPASITTEGSFTRASTGTYFDVDGVMQTATTNAPRINFDPDTGFAALLLEAAATNLLLYSEQFNLWTMNGGLAVTVDAMISPAGTLAADTTTTGTSRFQTVTVAIGTTYTYSVYIKPADPAKDLRLYYDGTGNGQAVINPTSGATSLTGTATSVTLMDAGNGWYRMSTTYTATATSNNFHIFPTSTDLHGWWGAQLEVGTVATSYIPTTTAAVTRAADVATGTGLIYCTTPEPASGETLWNAATSYTLGQVVARTTTHHLYENLIAGVDATYPENATAAPTPRWLDLGSTNRWSQFDAKIGTTTTSPTNLTTIIRPGNGEGLALLELTGVTADISVVNDSSVLYTATVDLDSTVVEYVYDWMFSDRVQKRNLILTDLPGQYPNMTVSVTVRSTSGAAIGVLAVGRVHLIGVTEYGAGSGIINYGKVADDGFGNRTWLEGSWANRVTLPLVANTSDFNRIHRQLADLRSTPSIYFGSLIDSLEPLTVYGVYRDMYITVPHFSSISLNLEIDGLSNS